MPVLAGLILGLIARWRLRGLLIGLVVGCAFDLGVFGPGGVRTWIVELPLGAVAWLAGSVIAQLAAWLFTRRRH